MKRNIDFPEYQEYKSFRLTNEQRPYFGLEKIDENWEEIEIKEGTSAFFEGDIIKKIITWENFRQFEHNEIDTKIETIDREYILPKTNRGKKKKITPTNLLAPMPTGCSLYITFNKNVANSIISASCTRNKKHLPITEDKEIMSITDLNNWIKNYIKTCPTDYFEKVNKMRSSEHTTVKYEVGDIFRFEIDREHYGFGLIIGKYSDIRKHNLFPENHPMSSAMTVPILVRLYKIKTKNPGLSQKEICCSDLLPPTLISDNEIIWGTHEIVALKELEENEIDFPMLAEYRVRRDDSNYICFAWGNGMKIINGISKVPNEIMNNNNCIGVSLGLPIHQLNRAFQGYNAYSYDDLRNTRNELKRAAVFELFELSDSMDIDAFNKLSGGLTRNEYIEWTRKIKKG